MFLTFRLERRLQSPLRTPSRSALALPPSLTPSQPDQRRRVAELEALLSAREDELRRARLQADSERAQRVVTERTVQQLEKRLADKDLLLSLSERSRVRRREVVARSPPSLPQPRQRTFAPPLPLVALALALLLILVVFLSASPAPLKRTIIS